MNELKDHINNNFYEEYSGFIDSEGMQIPDHPNKASK